MYKKLLLIMLACGVSVFALKPDTNAVAVLDDFQDTWTDAPNQNNIGACKGLLEQGIPSQGGGFWYTFYDANGSTVLNNGDQAVDATNTASLVTIDAATNKALHVKIKTSTSTTTYPYAGVGCLITGELNGNQHDLSKMTSLSMKIKGTATKGVIIHIITKDVIDLGAGWGYYEYVANSLTSSWQQLTIKVADLKPPANSPPANNNWTWDHGKGAAFKVEFQTKDKGDADIWVDDITFDGMQIKDFAKPITPIKPQIAVQLKNTSVKVIGNRIEYALAQPQQIKIALFSAQGKQISTLANRLDNPGSHNVTIDTQGSGYGTGIYICRFTANNESVTLPFMVVK